MTQNPKQPLPTPSDVFEQVCDDFLINDVRSYLHADLKKKMRTMPMPQRMLYGRRTANQQLWEMMSDLLGLIKDDTLQDADHEIALQKQAKEVMNWLIYRCTYTPSSDKSLPNPNDVYVASLRGVDTPQSSIQRLGEGASTSPSQENAPFDGNDTPTNLSTRG